MRATPSPNERGRASRALLLAIPLVLAGVVAWFALTPHGERHDAHPATLPISTSTDTSATGVEIVPSLPSVSNTNPPEVEIFEDADSAEARPTLLRFELIDKFGRPLDAEVDVEYRIVGRLIHAYLQSGPFVRFSSRGPRIEVPLDSRDAPESNRVQLLVRNTELRGETSIQASHPDEVEWPQVLLRQRVIVRGQLTDARDSPIEGVPILLRDDRSYSEPHIRTETDTGGAFEIDALPDRINRLFVGDPERPWVKPVTLDVAHGSTTLETIRVELHSARFHVQRADGNAAREARLEGTGSDGGKFALGVDLDGDVLVTTLLRGRWRIYASEAMHGSAARTIAIPLASDEPVLILLPR